MVSPKLIKFNDNCSQRVAFGRIETGAARGAVTTPGGGAKNMDMLLDAMGMLLSAMLWLAVALSTAAGVLAGVAIYAKRRQMRGRLARLARIFTAARATDGRPDFFPFCTHITRAQFACGTRVGLRCGRLWILL